MILVITEKKELVQAIVNAYGITQQISKGVYRYGDYVIIPAAGHLMRLKEPEEYDLKYKAWNLESLPIFFDDWQKVPKEGCEDRLNQIGRLIGQADSIIHVGDPDDEGQILIDEILEYFHNAKPVQRVLINDNTPKEVRKAFSQIQSNDGFVSMGVSAYARDVCDALVGFNFSRFYNIIYNSKGLSVGRVQSPLLWLVVSRDEAIKNHVKQKFYELFSKGALDQKIIDFQFKPLVEFLNEEKRIDNPGFLHEIIDAFQNKQTAVVVEKRITESAPPLPFNTAKIQSLMNEKYGVPISETAKALQQLRVDHQAITYNRVDSQFLKEEHFVDAPSVIPIIQKNIGKSSLSVNFHIHSKCFNDKNVSAHHAIIPTAKEIDINTLTPLQKSVYKEIADRYIMQFLPPIKKEVTTAISAEYKGVFYSRSTKIVDTGYSQYFSVRKDSSTVLSEIPAGKYETVFSRFEIKEGETKPPEKYTQASLIKDMTSIAKYVTDPKISAILKEKDKGKKSENGSIGTSATRDIILQSLLDKGFLQSNGKIIESTERGRNFCHVLPDDIRKPDMTALWWVIQEDIIAGRASVSDMTKSVLSVFCKYLDEYKMNPDVAKDGKRLFGITQTKTGLKCPNCGGEFIETPKGWKCENFVKRDVEGCHFYIPKEFLSQKISKENIKEIFEKGQCSKLFHFKPENKDAFYSYLKLNDSKQAVTFTYIVPYISCPCCGKPLRITKYGWFCSPKYEGCGFSVPNEILGQKISESAKRSLLAEKTIVFHNFISKKKNKTFDSGLKLDKQSKKIVFDFNAVSKNKNKLR